MFDFEFHNPVRIVFGKDRLETLDRLVPQGAKVLVTYGGGSAVRSGLVGRVKAALGSRTVHEFGGIEPNPQFDTLMKAVALVKERGIDFLLAVGGGSVIDGTKFVALAARFAGDPRTLLGNWNVTADLVPDVLPLGTVLTLPATGSEMNGGAVVSLGHDKLPVMSALTYPFFSLLDPSLTSTLPARQVANGIVDAFVHTTEQYLTFPVGGILQDRMAEAVLQTLVEIGRTSVDEPENYAVRAQHVWSATMALNGILAVGVPQDWATHMIGHELTALFGLDHAQSLAVVLPTLLSVRKERKSTKLVQFAERVWGIKDGSDSEKADLAIARTRGFFESLGVKTRLSEYGVEADRIPEVIAQLKAHGMTALGETRDLTLDIAEEILRWSL
jgi:NADP-dependent alcohol dehydrogenase